MKYRNVIWEGRYQPIHRGHILYVKTLLEYAEHLWIFIVENERSTDVIRKGEKVPVPEFTIIADEHHSPEKNPLPFWLRYRLVTETLRAELGSDAPITVWGGRRFDLAWPFYSKTLPPNRVFITPNRDSFEDAKANAWSKLGEKVIRLDIDHLPKISATQIRERIRESKSVSDLLCPKTEDLLREFNYFEKLAFL